MTRGEELLRIRDAERKAWLNERIAAERPKDLPKGTCIVCASPFQMNVPHQVYCKPCAAELHLKRCAVMRAAKRVKSP